MVLLRKGEGGLKHSESGCKSLNLCFFLGKGLPRPSMGDKMLRRPKNVGAMDLVQPSLSPLQIIPAHAVCIG